MPKLPKRFVKFTKDFPDVAKAYEALGDQVHAAGPLNAKTRALLKLAISIGARLEGSVHAHARKALAIGATQEELHHTALLSLPTIGFPSMIAALSLIDDVLSEEPSRKR